MSNDPKFTKVNIDKLLSPTQNLSLPEMKDLLTSNSDIKRDEHKGDPKYQNVDISKLLLINASVSLKMQAETIIDPDHYIFIDQLHLNAAKLLGFNWVTLDEVNGMYSIHKDKPIKKTRYWLSYRNVVIDYKFVSLKLNGNEPYFIAGNKEEN